MAGLMDALYRSFQNSRFKPLTAPLAIEGHAVGPGVRFGLPWPWTQSAEFEAPHDTEPVLEVTAPRTDMIVDFVVWRDHDSGSLEPIINTAGSQLAQIYRGRVVSTRKVLLDASHGVLVGLDDPNGHRIWRLVAERGGRLLHGQMRVPARAAAGYQPHLETMLATWEWG